MAQSEDIVSGPVDGKVLYGQEKHISNTIWEDNTELNDRWEDNTQSALIEVMMQGLRKGYELAYKYGHEEGVQHLKQVFATLQVQLPEILKTNDVPGNARNGDNGGEEDNDGEDDDDKDIEDVDPGFSHPSGKAYGFPYPSGSTHGFPDPSSSTHAFTYPSGSTHGFPYPSRSMHGFSYPSCGPPYQHSSSYILEPPSRSEGQGYEFVEHFFHHNPAGSASTPVGESVSYDQQRTSQSWPSEGQSVSEHVLRRRDESEQLRQRRRFERESSQKGEAGSSRPENGSSSQGPRRMRHVSKLYFR